MVLKNSTIVRAFWCSMFLAVFKTSAATVWDGITPWYTGSKCNCNGYSNRCFFDQKLYELTGHGGHCLDCTANRDGPNCERCRENYYMREDGYCISCDCNPTGSRNLQCNAEGKCQCKQGVAGGKCDRCEVNFYDFSGTGCKSCGCSEMGSADNRKSCDPYSGDCYCKENVEGKRCRECKPGFFNLDDNNNFGCTPCFCYGHSSECKSAPGFSKYPLESTFVKNSEKWTAEDQSGRTSELKYEVYSQSVNVKAVGDESIYFVAPYRFLGDKRSSYNQFLEFTLKISDDRCVPTAADIILEGGKATVTNTIFAQQNRLPSEQGQKYSFRLHEHPEYGWQPKLTSRAFISILSNLTSIKIRGTYSFEGVGFLENVKLDTALRDIQGEPALWIELCDCPTGYVGQFCESCAPGFRHFPPQDGAFSSCIPCDCNGHASICDSDSGRCICQHYTAGESCEVCARGYYGYALGGTPNDCKPCDCPNGGACIQLDESTTMCTECPQGYTGHRCDSCSDGYFGDPTGKLGPSRPCELCECNQNIDPNAIGNCNTTTGECLKCIQNTGGQSCEVCLPGYYGNALVLPKGDCKKCQCLPAGTEQDLTDAPICDQNTGSCLCKSHVIGLNCDRCENGYFNLHNGGGCQTCNCDPVGSLNQTCDIYTGQCYCRAGIAGLRCGHCESRKYGFSTSGCKECSCDPIGSKDLQCDATGQCLCLKNVEGPKCDRCKENKHDRRRGCVDCPECYYLIQKATRSHNDKLEQLDKILDEIEQQPVVITDEEFPDELEKVRDDIGKFHDRVKEATGENTLVEQVKDIKTRAKDVFRGLSEVDEKMYLIKEKITITDTNIEHADDVLFEAEEKLNEVENYYELQAKGSLDDAWDRAKVAGQQSERMTEIAHEAKDLADSLDNRAEGIVATSKEAKNKSIESYLKVKDANFQQVLLGDTISHIKIDLLDTEHKLNKTKQWTKEVSEQVYKVKNEAVALLSEVKNLVLPQMNVDDLRRKTDRLKNEANRLSDRSEQLFAESEDLRRDVDEQSQLGRELLQKAKEQQDEVEDIRNDLLLSEGQANAAIDLWKEVLEGAETNFKLLTEFDSQTQKSKEDAESALATITEIESIINQTLEDTLNSRDNLEEAARNANLALEKAEQADDLANNASFNAEQVRQEAEVLFKNTSALGEEAELMFDRVQNTEGQLKNLLEKTRSNESLVNEAAEKVGRAGKDTEEVSRKVQSLLGDVEEIMVEIQNSPNIDEREIDRLEEAIRRTEERLKETRLEETLRELQREHKLRGDLIEQYKFQIAELQQQVANVEQIVEALPDGCFKRVELEP